MGACFLYCSLAPWAAPDATPPLPNGAFDQIPFDEDMIWYHKSESDGLVTRRQERLDQGDLKLKYDPAYGYLLSLLEELKVPQSSQVLAFSKTSFQRERISPKTPRAIFSTRTSMWDDNPEFQKIPATSREAILQILIETKSDLPRYWTL